MANIYRQGDSVTLYLDIFLHDVQTEFIDPDGYLANPNSPTEPKVIVTDPNNTAVEGPTLATRYSTGRYKYTYQLESDAPEGEWKFEWIFTVDGSVLPSDDRSELFTVSTSATINFQLGTLVNVLRLRLKDNHCYQNEFYLFLLKPFVVIVFLIRLNNYQYQLSNPKAQNV